MKHLKTKKQCQTEHAHNRFLERFGVRLTQFLRDNILYQIHGGKAVLHRQKSRRVSIWNLTVMIRNAEILDDRRAQLGPLTIRVVYDALRKNIVSVLTLDMECEIFADYLEEA